MTFFDCNFYYSTTCQDSAESFFLTSHCVRRIILNKWDSLFFTTALLDSDSAKSVFLTKEVLSVIFAIQNLHPLFITYYYLTLKQDSYVSCFFEGRNYFFLLDKQQ